MYWLYRNRFKATAARYWNDCALMRCKRQVCQTLQVTLLLTLTTWLYTCLSLTSLKCMFLMKTHLFVTATNSNECLCWKHTCVSQLLVKKCMKYHQLLVLPSSFSPLSSFCSRSSSEVWPPADPSTISRPLQQQWDSCYNVVAQQVTSMQVPSKQQTDSAYSTSFQHVFI